MNQKIGLHEIILGINNQFKSNLNPNMLTEVQYLLKRTVCAFVSQVSDSDLQAVKPPPKRRRILDPSAIVPVPVYSNKVMLRPSWGREREIGRLWLWGCPLTRRLVVRSPVPLLCMSKGEFLIAVQIKFIMIIVLWFCSQVSSSLQLKPMAAVFSEKENAGKKSLIESLK